MWISLVAFAGYVDLKWLYVSVWYYRFKFSNTAMYNCFSFTLYPADCRLSSVRTLCFSRTAKFSRHCVLNVGTPLRALMPERRIPPNGYRIHKRRVCSHQLIPLRCDGVFLCYNYMVCISKFVSHFTYYIAKFNAAFCPVRGKENNLMNIILVRAKTRC